MGNKREISRREFVQRTGLGMTGLVVGSGIVSGNLPKKGKQIPDFDPKVRSEVRKASKVIRNIENRGHLQRQWAHLSDRQRDTLVEANEVETVEVVVEETVDPAIRTEGSDLTVGTNSHVSESKEVAVTTRAKNIWGALIAKFRHEVYWEYNYSEVTYLDASHEGTTHWPFWSFAGLSSKSSRRRGCAAESTRVGKFNYSVTKYGLIQQKNMGSEIDVQCDGAWTKRKIS